jgi:hypothetical protein
LAGVGANKPVKVIHDPDGIAYAIELDTPEGRTVLKDTDWLILPEGGTAEDFEAFHDDEFCRAFELVP